LGRSVRNLIDLVETLREREVGLRVLDQGIDTTTPAGRMFFHVLAALAEFEASLISERTHDGLEAARARGRKGGRRPKLSDRQVAMVRQMHASGEHTVSAIAETFGVTRPTIYRVLESAEASA
jgi:DNA invertase Pin-like site-specific DNA recombinase